MPKWKLPGKTTKMENNPNPSQPIQQAVTPPRPVTYKFMQELDKACDEFFRKRGMPLGNWTSSDLKFGRQD